MSLAQDGKQSGERGAGTSAAGEFRGTVLAVSCNGAYTFTKPVRDEIVLVTGFGVEGDVHAGINVRHRARVRADPTQPNLRQVHLIQGELFGAVAEKGYEVGAGQLGENVTTGGLDLLALPLGTILRFGRADAAAERGRDAAGGAAAEPLAAVFDAADAARLDRETATAVAALRAAVARDARGVRAAEHDQGAGDGRAARDDQGAGDGRAAGVDPRPAVILAGLRNPCAQINTFRPGLLKEVLGRDARGNAVRRAGVMAVVLRGGPVRPGDRVAVELPPPPLRALERV